MPWRERDSLLRVSARRRLHGGQPAGAPGAGTRSAAAGGDNLRASGSCGHASRANSRLATHLKRPYRTRLRWVPAVAPRPGATHPPRAAAGLSRPVRLDPAYEIRLLIGTPG